MMPETQTQETVFDLKPGREFQTTNWALRHFQTLFYSMGLLARTPVATLVTVSVIGFALALPAALYVLLENIQTVTNAWDGAARVSVFLEMDVNETQAKALGQRLAQRPEIHSVEVITPTQALAEYKQMSGFGEALDAFQTTNPLPGVLVVRPAGDAASAGVLATLVAALEDSPLVHTAQVDLAWLRRLQGIVAIVRRGVAVVASLLALGVILVVGNTISLGIDSRRDEITISRLCGASDAFIRRPFLYTGLWYGVLGGVCAWLLVLGASVVVRAPVIRLVVLYQSDFRLLMLDSVESCILLFTGALLGLMGSWMAVARHLAATNPG